MPSPPAPPRFDRDVIALFGLPFDVAGLEGTARRVADAAARGERLFLSTVNLDWLVQAGRDPAFRASALASGHVTMDGVPVVKLARMAGLAEAEKAAGSDLFDRLRAEPLTVFFFGGRPGAAEAAYARLNEGPGPMRATGWHDPGFGDVASMSGPEHLDPINESRADILIVALGAKKGQAWLMANRDRVTPPVVTHLGAVVDFAAGTVARAPAFLQRAGFEWAWRIGQDRALWRRYADDAGALPGLARAALAVRRGIAAGRAAAGPGEARLEGGRLTVSGAVGADALRAALKAADPARPLAIDLASDAAPDLRGWGQLLLARQGWRAAGVRHALCTHGGQAGRLAGLTIGADPVKERPSGAGL